MSRRRCYATGRPRLWSRTPAGVSLSSQVCVPPRSAAASASAACQGGAACVLWLKARGAGADDGISVPSTTKPSTRPTKRDLYLATKSPMRHWRLRRGTRRCPQQRLSARASAARVEQPTDWLSPSGFTSDCLEAPHSRHSPRTSPSCRSCSRAKRQLCQFSLRPAPPPSMTARSRP